MLIRGDLPVASIVTVEFQILMASVLGLNALRGRELCPFENWPFACRQLPSVLAKAESYVLFKIYWLLTPNALRGRELCPFKNWPVACRHYPQWQGATFSWKFIDCLPVMLSGAGSYVLLKIGLLLFASTHRGRQGAMSFWKIIGCLPVMVTEAGSYSMSFQKLGFCLPSVLIKAGGYFLRRNTKEIVRFLRPYCRQFLGWRN